MKLIEPEARTIFVSLQKEFPVREL